MGEDANIAGLRFGRYRAIREIGRGATSSVYLAEDTGDLSTEDAFGASDWSRSEGKPRQVAIKVVDFTDDRSKLSRRFRKLFATEAAVTAQFDHPNIARVYDWKVEEKRAYLVMELVVGDGLDQFVTMDKLLPMHRVVGIIFKVAMALDYAHRRGIVHRDIKPANVMLTGDDEVKLMDFGLALNIRKNVNIDSTFINGLGSPSYMSPEQIKGYTLNHQTDLYSLGVMFYQLLTGRLPFRGPNTAALVYKIINTEAVAVTQLNPDIPELTNSVIKRSLEKDLYSRYRLGADMAKDLSAVRFQILQETVALPDETRWKAVRGLPLLGKLDDVDVWELLRLSAWRSLPPATVIMRDGEPGKSFGFILDGEVEVEKGERALATLGRGEIIGEVAFLDSEGGTRTASVTTLNQVTYLEINSSAFAFATEELVAEIRRIAIDVMVSRMRSVNRLAKRFSPVAVHPTEVPEGEVDAPLPAAALSAPVEAPGWSVFGKPAFAVAAAALVPAAAPIRPLAAMPAAPVLPAAPAAPPATVPLWPPPDLPTPSRAPALTGRGTTVVVQPLPASAAAVIAQMALTQNPKSARPVALQPFELGPESGGEVAPPLSVADMPPDAVLTTELGAHFDASPGLETTELAGGFQARPAHAATAELGGRFASGGLATTEMAADFGRLPSLDEPAALVPDFDIHARTGRSSPVKQTAPTYAATTEMAAHFAVPLPSDKPLPGTGRGRQASLMPQTREIVDQSTQELAGHMLGGGPPGESDRTVELSGGFGMPDEDPLAQLGNDMFPPITGVHRTAATGDGVAPLDPDYEVTQVLDPASFAAAFPSLDAFAAEPAAPPRAALPRAAPARKPASPSFEDDEPYEATQMLDPGMHGTPAPSFDEEPDRTVDLAGRFGAPEPVAEGSKASAFPPLKY